eukprot:FR743216.1.p1 GENE.FR743216.1~~FR743216.1.p1  ORF type:complete len:166 (+),score=10.27 FR743216.1:86-583(+)
MEPSATESPTAASPTAASPTAAKKTLENRSQSHRWVRPAKHASRDRLSAPSPVKTPVIPKQTERKEIPIIPDRYDDPFFLPTNPETEEKQEDIEPQVETKDPGPVDFDEEEAPVSKEPVAPVSTPKKGFGRFKQSRAAPPQETESQAQETEPEPSSSSFFSFFGI